MKQIKKSSNNIYATTPSTNSVDHVMANNSIAKQKTNQSKKYTTTDQFNQSTKESAKNKSKDQSNQPVQQIPKSSENPGITPINLESVHHFLIATNHNEEKKYLSPQPEPMANKVRIDTRNNNERGFYAGIMFGVDMSSVHFQSAKTGGTAGFIIGYSFNKKWSIESGLLWDTKRVYDDGTYFNPPGYTPTSGVTITAVNGKSRLYELPVNMKYTIISGKHKHLCNNWNIFLPHEIGEL